MDPTQFMLPMPSMIPQFLPTIPTSTSAVTPATQFNTLPIDILGMWANGEFISTVYYFSKFISLVDNYFFY